MVRTVKLKLYITTNTYTTILSWMSILCLSLDYCDIYTSSEKKRRFMMLFFLGGGGWYGVSN